MYSLSKLLLKYSIKDAKYNICEKADWNQVVYCIKNIQHSMSVYTVHSYIIIYIYTNTADSHKKKTTTVLSHSETKVAYSHLTRISKDALKQQLEYKNHQK